MPRNGIKNHSFFQKNQLTAAAVVPSSFEKQKSWKRVFKKNGSEVGLTYLVHQMGIVLQELQDIILDAFHDIGDSRFAKTGLPEKTDRNDREKKGTGSHDSSKGSDSNLPENKTLM